MRYRDVSFDKVEVARDIPYASSRFHNGQEKELKLDIYRPARDTEPLPRVLLFVHGGGLLDNPNCDKSQSYIVELCNYFALRGYVCVSTDYRVRAEGSSMDGAAEEAARDLRKAIEFLRARSVTLKIDTNKLAAIGGSAGGRVLLRLLLNGDGAADLKVRALCLLWAQFVADEIVPSPDNAPPPAIIFHGDNDEVVPFEDAVELDELMNKNGYIHTFVPLKGAGHTCVDYAEGILGALGLFLLWNLDTRKMIGRDRRRF